MRSRPARQIRRDAVRNYLGIRFDRSCLWRIGYSFAVKKVVFDTDIGIDARCSAENTECQPAESGSDLRYRLGERL